MVDYGFQCYDDNNVPQFIDGMLVYFMRKTGTVTVGSGFGSLNGITLTLGSTYQDAIIGLSGKNGYGVGFELNGTFSAGEWRYLTDAPIGTVFNYYAIELADKIPPLESGEYGFEAYDASGNVIYSDSHNIAPVIDMIGDTGSVTLSGATLGVVPLAFAGWNRYADPESGDTASYFHDFGIYAAKVSTDGHTATAEELTIERGDVVGIRPPDSNQFELSGNFFILDVSNIPIGTTFF